MSPSLLSAHKGTGECMKISFVDDEPEIYPLQSGGKARTILALAQSALSFEAIDEVTVMSRSIDDPRDEFTDYGGVNFEKLDDHNMIGRIAQEAEEADVLSVHTCSFTFPRIPPDRRKAALAYHLHDVMLTTADKGSHLDKALGGDWDAIISPSAFATRTYRNFAALTGGSAEIHTIPRGIDSSLFHVVPRDEALQEIRNWGISIDDSKGPVLFFPGRAGVGKGDDRIGQICESLADEYPDLQVITTSDVDSLQQHDNVMHIGWQESARLKHLYSIANVTLSLSSLPESFCQVCMESVACGTPVLAFPFGNLSGLAESLPAVATCEPTTEAIITGIRQLLANPNMNEALNESRAILESTYNIREIGKTYVQLYMDIARRRREQIRIPELYFLSPFAAVHNGTAYLFNNDGNPLKSYGLNQNEAAILACCDTATSVEEIGSMTGLGDETIRPTLVELTKRKVIIGGRNGRNTRH